MEESLLVPTSFDELIGHKRTLQDWKEYMHTLQKDQILYVCGYSGVGKTKGTHLLLQEFQYNALFLETSVCVDGKDVLDRIYKFHQWMDLGASFQEAGQEPERDARKKVIVLDEVESFIKIDRNVLHCLLTYKKKYKENSLPIVLLGHMDTLKKLGDIKHSITYTVKLQRLQDIDMFLYMKKRLPKNKIKLTELMKIAEDANGSIHTALLTVQQRFQQGKKKLPLANYVGDEQRTFPEIFACKNPMMVDKLLMEDDWMNPLKIHENIIKIVDHPTYAMFLGSYIYYEHWRTRFDADGNYETMIPIMYLTNVLLWYIHHAGEGRREATLDTMDFSKLLSYISTQKKYKKLMYEKVPITYPIEDLGLYWVQTYKESKKRGKDKDKDVENIL